MPVIEITLESDLCAGSGQGFAHAIDSDVCYDRFGLPYIPSRRIKGALRDAAKYIDTPDHILNAIFGIPGNQPAQKAGSGPVWYKGGMRLYNARLKDYKQLKAGLENGGLEAESVLRLFTRAKAQTEVFNGVAKRNSLRFTRVVNQYSPLSAHEKLVFYAECEIDGKFENTLKDICKAARNIGLDRTRGLGAVKMRLIESGARQNANAGRNARNTQSVPAYDPAIQYCIDYSVYLESPLMLPDISNDETADYISGTAVIGALASKYLARPTHTLDEFERLFLSGGVVYENAYIHNAIPAPLFVNKLKQRDGVLFTVYGGKPEEGTPKTLKGKYVDKITLTPITAETEINYHHRRDGDEMLYTQKCLCEGQVFKGVITAGGAYVSILEDLLAGGLCLGRSKTAEYARCSVQYTVRKAVEARISVNHGDKLAAALESDLICLDDNGGCSADKDIIFHSIGIQAEICDSETFLSIRRIAGYSGVWNLKKPHITAIAAGSVFTFTYKGENGKIPQYIYTGEKQNEGFGKVKIYRVDDLVKHSFTAGNGDNPAETAPAPACQILKNKVANNAAAETMRLMAIDFANRHKNDLLKLNAAFVGRVYLMVKQAAGFQDFKNRVASIRSKEKKNAVNALISKFVQLYPENAETVYKPFFSLVFSLAKYWLKDDDNDAPETEDQE